MATQIIDTPENVRSTLVKLVKCVGQDLIDRAEDLVGTGDLLNEFGIDIDFPMDGRMLMECPTIEVRRRYIVHDSLDPMVEYHERMLFRE